MSESLTIEVACDRLTFPFTLEHRRFDRGLAESVDYYWLDKRPLLRAEGQNFRSCVELTWTVIRRIAEKPIASASTEEEAGTILQYQVAQVLIDLYLHLHGSKARREQKIFEDATLHYQSPKPDATAAGEVDLWDPKVPLVREEVATRCRAIAESRDVEAIGKEIDKVLGGPLPDPMRMPNFQRAFDRWIRPATMLLERNGREVMQEYITEAIVPYVQNLRRRGGNLRIKQFLNMFAYEAKARFIGCHARAWVHLIPRLREVHELSPVSERMLRLWHMPNQVMRGQAISLHPISAILMTKEHHRPAIDVYLQDLQNATDVPDHERPAYWGLVGSILIACHEYQYMKEVDEGQRSPRRGAGSDERARGAVDSDQTRRTGQHRPARGPAHDNNVADQEGAA